MSHFRHRLPYPLLLAAAAALLLPRLPARAQDQRPPPPDLHALGVPMDQLPHAQALLQAELDKITAAGGPVTLAEAAPPPVPDAENAALVYQQAFAALKFAPPGEATPIPPRLIQPSAGAPPAPAPSPPSPAPEEAPPLPAAGDESHYVAGNLEAIALLEKAAGMPRCRWPVDWSAAQPWMLLLPTYSKLRSCASLLAAKMRIETRAGNPDDMLHTCAVSLALPRSLDHEPSLISDLIQAALYAISTDGLRRCLGLERPAVLGFLPAGAAPEAPPLLPSTPACRALFLQLGQIDPKASLHQALVGERAVTLAVIDTTSRAAAAEKSPSQDKGADEGIDWGTLFASPEGRQVVALDEAVYLRVMAELIREADLPWREGQAPLAATEARIRALPAYCNIIKMFTPGFLALAARKRDQTAADLGRAQIALALVACHNETGQWPETLDQLHKVVGWDLPADPFSGKDFVYRRDGEGWVLYSVGPNLKDDGGKGHSMVWRRR